MTSFAVQSTLGAAAPLVSKDKGSVGNRMDCAGEHIKNNVSTGVQSTAVAGSTALAYGLVNKKTKGKAMNWNIKFNRALKEISKKIELEMKILDFRCGENIDIKKGVITKAGKEHVINTYGKVKGKIYTFVCNSLLKFLNSGKKVIDKIAKTSGRPKILAGILLSGLALLTYVQNKHSYKAGQIDQKYTDKAQLQKAI